MRRLMVDGGEFVIFICFGLCKYTFSTVSSLWEVRLDGAECVDAKTRLKKLHSCELPLKNTFSRAILVGLDGRQANLQSINLPGN